jgi:hypothetical protein
MPAPILVQHSLLFTSAEDRFSIMQGLRAAQDPLILIRLPAYGGEPQKVDLIDWIKAEFEVVERYRGYLLLKRAPATPAASPGLSHPQAQPAKTR